MENYNTATNANDAEFPQTGAAPNVDSAIGPTESSAPAPADPLTAAGVEELLADPGPEAPKKTSNIPAPVAVTTNSVTSPSNGCDAKPAVNITGIREIARADKTTIKSWKPPFEVQEGSVDSMVEIIQRATRVRAPASATPAPTGAAVYGTTEELFRRLQKAIAAQTSQSEQASALPTYWTIASWFPDGLTLAPGLAIIGPAYEGDLVLRTLRNFCRNPLMMTGITATDLKAIDWKIPPTIFGYEPNLTKQMAALLGSAVTRGNLVGGAGKYQDFYGFRGLYIGEELPADRIPRCSLQINVLPAAAACATQNASRLAELEVQELQNLLLGYRLKNLVRVYNSDFDASTLTSDIRAIANALGACIVDSPELQSQLISLLTPIESQRQTDRTTGIEAVTLEATLNLAHQATGMNLLGEIAAEANRLVQARGERARSAPKPLATN